LAAVGHELGFDFGTEDPWAADRGGLAESEGVLFLNAEQVGESDLRGWAPLSVAIRDGQPVAEWIYFGNRRFTEPSFGDSVHAVKPHPFSKLFRFESPLPRAEGVREPAGFIFHMSRCGSTLISRALGALQRVVAVSEAAPIGAMIQTGRCDWVRAIILAMGRPQDAEPNASNAAYVVKFDSWHIHQLALIRAAFPDTPWIFVHRNPLEVLVSQIRSEGMQGRPGAMDPAILGMTFQDIIALNRDEWCARVLERFLRSAMVHRDDPAGMFVDYRDLPEAIWGSIARHFHMTFDDEETRRMRETVQFHAKSPHRTFEADSDAKRLEASPTQRALAEALLNPLYERISESRASGMMAVSQP
jgi:hypothetical protein